MLVWKFTVSVILGYVSKTAFVFSSIDVMHTLLMMSKCLKQNKNHYIFLTWYVLTVLYLPKLPFTQEMLLFVTDSRLYVALLVSFYIS